MMPLNEAVNICRKANIQAALIKTEGNICRAARELGTHRNNLTRWMHICGITAKPFKVHSHKGLSALARGQVKQWHDRNGVSA